MAESLIGPWFIQIRYRSKYALHTFRHSTVPAYVAPVTGDWTFDNTGGGSDVTVDAAVNELADLWEALYPNTWAAIDYVLLEQQETDIRAHPRTYATLDQVGTLAGTFLTDRATQLQYNFQTEDGLPMKHTLMDFPIGSFVPNPGPLTGGFEALRAYVMEGDPWLVARTAELAFRFVSLTATINNRNEHKYNRLLLS